jgi:hypothetical protein
MPYTKTAWADEVPASSPVKYKITDDVEGVLADSAKIELVTSVTPGTPLNADNLNHLEDGVETAQETAEDALADAASAAALATAAKAVSLQIQICDSDVELTTSIIGYAYIPSKMNGFSLVRAQAFALIAGTTGATTIQIRNLTKYPSNDALSGAISIASGSTTGAPGTVNTSYDDISTDDQIKIYVTAQALTPARGLIVILEYEPPA